MNRYSAKRILAFCLLVIVSIGIPGCSGPAKKMSPSKDTELQRLMAAGHSSFSQSRIDRASHYYREALFQARVMDNSSAISDAAYNLAACHIRMENYEYAKNLLQEAREEILNNRGNITQVLLVEAKIARVQNKLDESWSLTERLLTHLASHPSDEILLQVYVLRGHIAGDQGDLVRADDELKNGESYTRNVSSPLVLAGYAGLAGRIHLRKNRPDMAAKEFDREAGLLKEAEQYREMLLSLENAAEAHEKSGSYITAADRFIRAARSAFALEDIKHALQLGKRSLAAANAANDQTSVSRAQRLINEINTSSHRVN